MTNIFIPKYTDVVQEIKNTTRIEGEYTFEVRKGNGDLVRTVGPFKNLITNQGLNSLGGAIGGINVFNLNSLAVGTGTATPQVTDTSLQTQRALSNSKQLDFSGNLGVSFDYAGRLVQRYRFTQGQANGNITEVGIGFATTSTFNMLFSRALIVDGSGNPIAITVLPDEFLDVTYSLYAYPDLTNKVSTVTDSATTTTHTFTSRIFNASSVVVRNSDAIAIVAAPSAISMATRASAGTPVGLGSITSSGLTGKLDLAGNTAQTLTTSPYVTGSYTVNQVVGGGLNAFNPSTGFGIEGVELTSSGAIGNMQMQMQIRPPIMKTSNKILTIGVSMTWARKTP